MLKRPYFARQGYWLAVILASSTLMANDATGEQEPPPPSAFQQLLDEADDATRSAIEELRRLEQQARQMQAVNLDLSRELVTQARRQQRLEQALDQLDDTRASLPEIEAAMVQQLAAWIDADLPFLKDQRLARLEAADSQSTDSASRIAELLDAWRMELAYGREVDSWRGRLQPSAAQPQEVDYLRIGRIGLYYLTPDGQQGGVWDSARGGWQPLDEKARREVRNGVRIVDEQRTPELLRLPLSVRPDAASGGQR